MAQHDYVIANGSGAAVRSDLNDALAAIVSNNSGASEPTTTYAYQWWGDTSAGLLKIRNAANNGWVTVGTLGSANLGLATLAGPSFTDDVLIYGLTVGRGAGAIDTNTAVGNEVLQANTSGHSNTANGYRALYSNETGTSNTANGRDALYSNETGNNNTANGRGALQANIGGSENTANGYAALLDNTTGNANTAIGYVAIEDVTTGSNNTGIGYRAGTSSSPSGSITTQSNVICLGNNSITALYCAETTILSSDGRDKTDVEDFTAGLDFVNKMRPVTYRWDKRADYLDDENTDLLAIVPDGTHKRPKQHVGFIAQEIEVLEQELGFATSKDSQLFCNTNEDDTAMGIKYERLIPVLVNAIQELSAEIKLLKGE